jgi:aminopeptidase N
VKDDATVTATLKVKANPARGVTGEDLILDSEAEMLTLTELAVNGEVIDKSSLTFTSDAIRVPASALPISSDEDEVTVRVITQHKPCKNTALSGLYTDGNGDFMTQMEAEGFRRFCPYIDRPDVLSTMNCRVEGNKATHPVLLSNGNFDSAGELPDGRHYVAFVDPVPKPAYLFALVAADL